MILFSLQCSQGHVFEEWFTNGAEFDQRKAADALVCPECASHEIDKAIMAPNVARKGAAAPPVAPRCTPQGCGSCAFAGMHD
ncbi:MAG: DUF1178 family protein [Magnetospirillum sp.]|nr:DUF1178 family protein [Magnetospirillum sp.]